MNNFDNINICISKTVPLSVEIGFAELLNKINLKKKLASFSNIWEKLQCRTIWILDITMISYCCLVREIYGQTHSWYHVWHFQ